MAPARSTAGLLSGLSTLAKDRRLRVEDGWMNGEADGEIDGGMNGWGRWTEIVYLTGILL